MPTASLLAHYVERCVDDWTDEAAFEYIFCELYADELDEMSLARNYGAWVSLHRMVGGGYSSDPNMSPTPTLIRRATRIMQLYTNGSYGGNTPSVVMREIRWMRERAEWRPWFDTLNTLVSRWYASRLALVLRPVGVPGRNAIVDLLYVQDGEGVVAKTVRDFVREMSVL